MSITLDHGYQEGLITARPTFFGSQNVKPPPGAQGEERIESSIIIPPINTDINFSMLPTFQLSSHEGLAALTEQPLEITFNWRDGPYDEKKGRFDPSYKLRTKMALVSTPGNQMLCGSCWAISVASIVGDSFVISDVVDWKPNLSTTYCLACYPQKQCHGGNPAKLLVDLSNGGIVSNHCIDYSWCSKDQWCNGDALKHFKVQHEKMAKHQLNPLIPNCGCLEKGDFYKFMVDGKSGGHRGPQQLSIGMHDMKPENLVHTIKTHIRHRGPVLGSFLVFKNFMKGYFAKGKANKGLYLENATYNSNGTVTYTSLDKKTYVGSHAVAIVGWGIEKDVQVDDSGKKKDVPYWFVRNSWTPKWADKGYFKMPMFPVNKLSQFDKLVRIRSPSGAEMQGGGMIVFNTSKPPTKVSFEQVAVEFASKPRSKANEYYKQDQKDRPKPIGISPPTHFTLPKFNLKLGTLGKVIGSLILFAFIFLLGFLDGRGHEKEVQRVLICTIVVLTLITTVLAVRLILIKSSCNI